MTRVIFTGAAVLLWALVGASIAASSQWTVDEANKWYNSRPWIVGSNYIPANAINQLEMFQADTFDPATIDKELALAESLGFNSIRVFLHSLLWDQDSEGFLNRFDTFLGIADRHNIQVMPVLFDSCWDPNPRLGKQRPPTPFIHNSGWLQSPGIEILDNPKRHKELEGYVKGVVSRFKNDTRINVWDVFNEPDNPNPHSYYTYSLSTRAENALNILKLSYRWIREVGPIHPITSGVWTDLTNPSPIQKFQLEQSDILSFHSYDPMPGLQSRVTLLQKYSRPIINTEYMARPMGSTFNPILGYFKANKIGAHNWGFVFGKTQTVMPWDSWCNYYTKLPPLWFHDIFNPDHTPYSEDEVNYIRQITGAKA